MINKEWLKYTKNILILFAVISVVIIALSQMLNQNNINNKVLLIANGLLMLISVFNLSMHLRAAAKKANPNVLSRSILGATIIKLFVLALVTVIYLVLAKESRSIGAILVAMLLYIGYNILEVKAALQINKK